MFSIISKLVASLTLFCFSYAYASLPEYYGSSARTSSLGNQFSADPDDSSNNYYAPALLAYSKSMGINYNIHYISNYFRAINNVVTDNNVTSNNTTVGNFNTSYDASLVNSIHAVFPILDKRGPKLAISLYIPVTGNSSDTLNPLGPEYVMYRSRHERTVGHFNLAVPFSQNWAFSVGAYTGSRVDMTQTGTTRYTTSGGGNSFGQSKIEAQPTISALLSLAWYTRKTSFYAGFQQEMKSKIEGNFSGLTADSGQLFAYNYNIASTSNYDPHIIRLGLAHKWNPMFKSMFGFEYQFWNNYDSPFLNMSSNSGLIVGSRNFQTLSVRNIPVLKLGAEFYLANNSTLRAGYAYQPSPFDHNLGDSGNLIDLDKHIVSLGYGLKFKLWGQDGEWNTAAQGHFMQSEQILKKTGMENGLAGDKIGAPGYRVGGTALAFTTGIQLSFANLFR